MWGIVGTLFSLQGEQGDEEGRKGGSQSSQETKTVWRGEDPCLGSHMEKCAAAIGFTLGSHVCVCGGSGI